LPEGNRARWVAVVLASVCVATLLRMALQPILAERAVFLLAILAVAVSSHLAGLWAGIVSMLLAIPLAAHIFLGASGTAALGVSGWVQLLLSMSLAIPLSLLGGRFHRLVHELDHALHRERAARAEAEHAARARDEFLAVLSHELKTPLNAIVGWAHVLKSGSAAVDTARAIETILRNADHQVRLISDITDLSRGITGKLRLESGLVDVRTVLEQALDAVRLAAEARGLKLQLLVTESSLLVQGDSERLRQVFWNLLSNAIKFSTAGASVQSSAGRDGEQVVVTVSDTGQGIASEFLPHVFDIFRQEDASKSRRQGGLGIGLAIVRHLTEAHGGTVQVHSDGRGRGAVFTIRLPARGAAVVQPASLAEVDLPQLAGVRVLVIDDDADTRELLCRSLGELGANVVTASSAAEARLEISRQPPDAILSDIGMPDEDGLAFVRSLKKHAHHATIPAIALTAYSSTKDRGEALEAGYYEHMAKPAPPQQLARVIAAALRRAH
jgi:signal transduction histidine kinase/ActR/RegA family two-component response regulator